MKLKTLIALIAGAVYGLAQTPPQIPSTVELMQTRGAINTALAQIATIACAGTPGNTTGAYGQQCQTTLGARYSCNNAAGCTVAADWVFSGSMSWPSGAGIAVYNGSGGWGTSLSPSAFEPALGNPGISGYVLSSTTGGTRSWVAQSGGGGSMVYPGAGIANSTGSAWGTSYSVGTTAGTLAAGDHTHTGVYQPAGSYQATISGAPGTWPTLGTASSHATTDFQAPITAYSTISGLSGYPSTFPPTTSGDWTGTWGTHAVGYFQAAISGAPGTWPTLGTASTHAAGDFEAALGNPSVSGYVLSSTTGGARSWVAQSGGGGSMVYPAAGVPNSTGSAWGSSYTVGTAANNLVQLNGSAQLPAVSAALLTNWPTFNQSTTGTAAGLTSQYVDWTAGSGGASIANKPTLGTAASHAATDFQTALTAYSTISGLSGYPSTFPPTTSGDWTGTWQTHAPSYFQTAISGAPGTWPSFGTMAPLNNPMTSAGDLIVGGASGALTRLAVPGNGTFCPSWSSGTVTWITCPGAGGGLSSVGLTMPSWFSVGSSPLTSNGTIAVTAAGSQTSHQVIGTCGSATSFAPCALVAADIPALSYQAALSNYSTISALTGYPSTFPPTNSGDWAGTWQTHPPSYFQAALTNYSTISGLTGYPSTFPPTTSGDWTGTWGTHAVGYFQTAISGAPGTWPTLGTAASHAATDFQTALTAYSSISGLSGYPSTFPPTTSGDWGGTWQTHAPSYFQTAISGAPGTWPSFGGAALLNIGTTTGTVAAGDDSRMSNTRTPTSHAASHQNGGSDEVATATPTANAIPKAGSGGTLGSGWIPALNYQAPGMVDILRFGLCYPAGCGSERTINYQATLANGTFSFCAFNLAVAPTGSSVIADVRNASGVSIFGATKLVIPVGSTSVVTQATFANSPQTFSSTDKFMAIITQNDSGNTAQGGLIQCR